VFSSSCCVWLQAEGIRLLLDAMKSSAELPLGPPSWHEESLISGKLHETRTSLETAAQLLQSLLALGH
jgi:hypothetical protein